MIEELPNGKRRFILEFEEYHWKLTEDAAKKLGYDSVDDMFSDVTLAALNKAGLNPLRDWI
jgi:hypothetical protein